MARKSASVARRGTRKPAGAARTPPRSRAAAGTAGKAATKRSPKKAGVAKKSVAKTPAPKKVAARKTVAKKALARKPVAKRSASKKTVARKPAVKKAAVRKTAPKKAAVRSRGRQAPPAGAWTETLRDGTQVRVRPITKNDAALERAFLARLSPQSRRLRFLGQFGEPSDVLVRELTDLDWRRDAAFIAVVERDGETLEVGVSRYGLGPDGRSCECAVTVDDEWHGRGLAVILMRHLIELARSRGIGTMFSIDAADNRPMRDLAKFLGFTCKADPDDRGQVIHSLALAR